MSTGVYLGHVVQDLRTQWAHYLDSLFLGWAIVLYRQQKIVLTQVIVVDAHLFVYVIIDEF